MLIHMILAFLISFFKCWKDRSSNATSLAVKSWLFQVYQSNLSKLRKILYKIKNDKNEFTAKKGVAFEHLSWHEYDCGWDSTNRCVYKISSQTTTKRNRNSPGLVSSADLWLRRPITYGPWWFTNPWVLKLKSVSRPHTLIFSWSNFKAPS